jgi:mRNA interferase MazF
VKRGEFWTVTGPGYAGKPRPVLILQDDAFAATDSVIVALMTTDPTAAPLLRLPVAPNAINNLSQPCSVMVDKIVAVPRAKLGRLVGRLDGQRMATVGAMAATLLGLARPPSPPTRRTIPGAAKKARSARSKSSPAQGQQNAVTGVPEKAWPTKRQPRSTMPSSNSSVDGLRSRYAIRRGTRY